MSAKVNINLGSEDVELKLEYTLKNNDMNISLHDDEGEDIISDKLSQFTSIDIDDNTPLKITLKGPKINRVICFQKESDASDFFTTLQKVAKLAQLPGPSHSFILTMEPHQVNLTDYIPLVGFFNKTISSTVKTVKNIVIGKELELPKQEDPVHTDGFRLGYIKESLTKDDLHLENYDPTKIDSLKSIDFKSSSGLSSDIDLVNLASSLQRVSHIVFSEEQIFVIWCKILLPRGKNKLELLEDYKKIGLQWKTVSKGQWDHSFSLRSYVVKVEKSINESKILSVPPYNKIAFDILLSMFAFHFSKFEFNQNFIQFLEILIPTCIKNVNKNGSEEDYSSYTFETHLGESLNIDDICSTIFWIFKAFSERFIIAPPPGSKSKVNPKSRLRQPSSTSSAAPNSNNSNNDVNNTENTNANIQLVPSGSFNLADSFVPSLPELFLSIRAQLSSISPSTNSLLETRGIKTLDFCVDDFKSFFVRNRPLSDAQLFLTAMISASNTPQFLASVLCSLLVLLQSALQRVPIYDEPKNQNGSDGSGAENSAASEKERKGRVEMFRKIFATSLPLLDMRLILYNEEGLCGSRSRVLAQQQQQQQQQKQVNSGDIVNE